MAQLRLTSWRRVALVAILPVYGAIYSSWYLVRWGDPALQLAIADIAFIPIGLFAVAAAFRIARVAASSGSRRAWAFIGLGFAAYAFGDLTWFWIEIVQGQAVPFPSLADLGYLAFFPLMLVGLGLLPRERPEGRLRSALDMALVLVGAGVAVWWLVLGPVVAGSEGDLLNGLLAMAYPVGDTLVLFVLLAALLARLTDTPRTVLSLLAIGLAVNVAADLAYARLLLEGDSGAGTWMDLMYLVGWVAMGSAAVIQGTAAVRRDGGSKVASLRPVTVLPYLAITAVYIPLAVSAINGGGSDRVLVAGAIAVTALVVARQILTSRDNAALMSMQASARAAARFQALIRNASDVILVTDSVGQVSFATPSSETVFGREPSAVEGGSIAALLDPAEARKVLALLGAAAGRAGISGPSAFRVAGAEEGWVEIRVSNLLDDPLVSGLVATIHDITERRAFEQQLEVQALHDPLTHLANRVLFADRVERANARARRSGLRPAVLYLDLDEFKRINNTIGHAAGDAVLQEVAARIQRTIRGEDTAARLGSDEFAVLLDETRDVAEAVLLAERLLAALTPHFVAGDARSEIGCSIGIVRSGQKGASTSELLRDGEIAMYAAKRAGRGSYRVFEPAMHAAAIDQVRLEADLRVALDRGELHLAYQPLITLADGSICGVEALLRWQHPERGMVMPADFIPLAEESGQIRRIGTWLLEEACRTVGGWNAVFRNRHLTVNVNVSVAQLQPEFIAEVKAILGKTGFPAKQLVIEITESVFSEDRSEVVDILVDLRRLGVRISIDDFGTGYSSLSRLRDLPVDELKVDRAFVTQLGGEADGSLVSTILNIARKLSLATVAEGVEEVSQLDRLRELGCDIGQGYLFGRPTDPATIAEMLTTAHAKRSLAPAA